MILKIKLFTILYFTLILARIFLGVKLPEFNLLLGGALCGSLLAYYIIKVKHQNHFYILSLITAMIADIILAFGKTTSIGLSYIFYGVFYVLLFMVLKRAYKKPQGLSLILGVVIILFSLVIGFIYLANNNSDWRFAMYLIPAMLTTTLAVNLKTRLSNPITIGTILIFVSAVLLFLGSVNELPFFIPYLFIYAIGQYLICDGLISSYAKAQIQASKK